MESCYHFNINSELLIKLAHMRANLQKERKMNVILRKRCRDLALLHCQQYLSFLEPDSTMLPLLQQALSAPVQPRPTVGLNDECRKSNSLILRRSFNSTSPERSLSWFEMEEVSVDDSMFSEEIQRTSTETTDSLRQGVTVEKQIAPNTDLEAGVADVVEPTGRHQPRTKVVFNVSHNINTDVNNIVRGNEVNACRENNCSFKNQYWLRNRTVVFDFSSNSSLQDDIEEDHPQVAIQDGRYTSGRQNEGDRTAHSEEGPKGNLSKSQYWLRSRTIVFGNSTNILFQDGIDENHPAEDEYPNGRRTNNATLPEISFSHFQASDHSTPRQQQRR